MVVSLVRSNEKGNPGFLKTSNRINVLLSRAQHGMYILGNSKTMENVKMWADVLGILRANNLVGTSLELSCPRHPDTPLVVTVPDDFIRVAPEAGCDLICNDRLECGHKCLAKCHAEHLHNAVYCLEPCNRPPRGCTVHVCPNPCGATCPSECAATVDNVSITPPGCDHEKTSLPCYQARDPSRIECDVKVTRTVDACGHEVIVECHVDVNSTSFICDATCGTSLGGCGHHCRKACYKCRKLVDEKIVVDHGRCNQVCDRDYTTCSHSDRGPCHGKEDCKPCNAKCEVACSHSACKKACSESCVPCAEPSCATRGCTMPCAAPCNSLPSSARCEELLTCGHRCPTTVGEQCPDVAFCQKCGIEENLEQQADYIELKPYREIDLDEEPCIFTACGHIYTITSLDGSMDMNKFYEINPMTGEFLKIKTSAEPFSSDDLKVCPDCRGPLRNLARYGRIVRRAVLDESVKKLVVWANRRHFELNERVVVEQERLLKDIDTFRKPNQVVNIGGSFNNQISSVRSLLTGARYRGTWQLLQDIKKFVNKLRQEEQPYQRIQDLVETARRQNLQAGIDRFEFDSSELQLREYLQASSLLLRGEIVLFSDVVNAHHKTPPSDSKGELSINFGNNRERCESLIKDAKKAVSILQEAEGHVFWARFAALECGNMDYESLQQDPTTLRRMEGHNATGLTHLDDAEAICTKLGDSTESLQDEIKEVRRMLNEGTSESEMRMVVAVMAREFSGTGHWYRCVNGHPFTIGQCGMPMELARCGCGARIGGRDHQTTEGVQHAGDIERDFGAMNLGR